MLKPTKQHKLDQSQETAEDPDDSSEAKANVEYAANTKSLSPELSHEALLKHIATIVAKEGMQMQTMLQKVFTSFEYESRVSALEDDIGDSPPN